MASPQAKTHASASNDHLASIKGGEYLIHVFIEETRGLRHPQNDDQAVDPVLKIQTGTNQRLSKPKSGIGSGATYWGEHFFFEKNYSTSYEAEKEKIIISVLDHSSLGVNALIGSVEFNLSAIYQKQDHCLQHQWAALSGLTKKFQEVLGFIKFSIGVFQSDDKQVNFEDEKIVDSAENKPTNVLYPPQVDTKNCQVRIRLFRGENLKKMDSLLGKCDPYVKVEYGGLKVQSRVIKVTYDPVWNEELLIPATLPTINEKISLKLIDWESPPQTDETMGSCAFKIDDIIAGKYKKPFWVNIYGPPTGANKKYEKIMTEVPEVATEWQARLQLAIDLTEEQKPALLCRAITDQKIIEESTNINRVKFILRADVHYALNLPKDGKFLVKIRWGSVEMSTQKKETRAKLIELFQSLALQQEFPVTTMEETEVPDLFIYVNDDSKNISYLRKHITEFNNPNTKAKCYYFAMDKSLSNMRDDLAGIVKMRILVSKKEDPVVLAKYGWDKPLQKKPNQMGWRVHFNVFQAKNLVSGDGNGLSDPFMNVHLYGNDRQTSVIDNTVNPIWNERLEFGASFDTIDDAPPFILTVWDKDSFNSFELLGNAFVDLEESDLNPTGKVTPRWVTLRYGKLTGHYGKVLVTICCYNRAELIPKTINIQPEAQRYYLNVKVIGLRNLKSAGLLPVKRAFIRFDVDSISRKEDKTLLQEDKYVKTEPLDAGPDPNILTVFNLTLTLPVDPDFCPDMSASVFDQVFRGLSQPLIGNFSIPLGDYIRKTQKELDKKIETLAKLNETLKSGDTTRASLNDTFEERKVPDILAITKETMKTSKIDIVIDTNKNDKNKSAKDKEFVIYPNYDKNGNEIKKPDPSKYMELGYTKKHEKSTKHYRYILDTDLETGLLDNETPFDEIPLYRGKQIDEDVLIKGILEGKDSHQSVGTFKAMINIMSEAEKKRYDSKLAEFGEVSDKGLDFSDAEFLRKKECLVRVYMIEAEGLVDKDEDSNSDPYLILKLGDTKYDESKHYVDDEPNPKFFKCYEFSTTFPGASKLEIEIWDHDDLSKDDLIGRTVIDLEDRWFSPKYRALGHSPIETRLLYNPSSRIPQGKVRLWVDIIPRDIKKPVSWNITPKPPLECELRVVVWDAKGVPRVDVEDTVDIFINARLEDGQTARTDTHFRSTDGNGSFNWRMVFPILLPMKKHRITFQIMDKDLFSSNDYISEATLDFNSEAMKAYEREEAVSIMGTNFHSQEKFWIQCSNTKMVAGRNVRETLGEICVSLMIVPKEIAKTKPVGQGRNDPNQHPYLPPPTGRIQFTMNPKKIFEQMIGPMARSQILKWLGTILCVLILILMAPTIIATLISRILF